MKGKVKMDKLTWQQINRMGKLLLIFEIESYYSNFIPIYTHEFLTIDGHLMQNVTLNQLKSDLNQIHKTL